MRSAPQNEPFSIFQKTSLVVREAEDIVLSSNVWLLNGLDTQYRKVGPILRALISPRILLNWLIFSEACRILLGF